MKKAKQAEKKARQLEKKKCEKEVKNTIQPVEAPKIVDCSGMMKTPSPPLKNVS